MTYGAQSVTSSRPVYLDAEAFGHGPASPPLSDRVFSTVGKCFLGSQKNRKEGSSFAVQGVGKSIPGKGNIVCTGPKQGEWLCQGASQQGHVGAEDGVQGARVSSDRPCWDFINQEDLGQIEY